MKKKLGGNQSISGNAVISALFLIAPQFYTTDPDQLAYYNGFYDLLLCQINPQVLSCCGALAAAFLLAAYLSITPYSGTQSAIAEGDLSINFNVNPDISFLELNPYGRAYLDLIARTVGSGAFVTNLPVQFGGVIQNMPVGCGCSSGFGYGWGNAGDGGGCGCEC